MDKQAAIRRVRIAVSVFFGVLTVALCVLWVRSYLRVDRLHIPTARKLELSSSAGIIRVSRYAKGVPVWSFPDHFEWLSNDVKEFEAIIARFRSWSWDTDFPGTKFSFPHWFVIALCGSSSLIVWNRYRFSLRTLLIATTLVAVGLGLGVWLAR